MISATDILRGKILIVDDQDTNVRLLERVLRGAGYLSVDSTTDSSKVSELHLVNRYDLILLDLHMPGMDGFQVMENLKQIETEGYLPVLVVTAQSEHKVRALKAGARDFVSKPFDLAEVLARVHNMVEVRLLHREAKLLHGRVLAEHRLSERLVTEVPVAIGEHFKANPEGATPQGVGRINEGTAEFMVLFADVLEFTRYAEGASGAVLQGVLTAISSRFDANPERGAFKRTTAVSDAYLAAVGLPEPVAIHSIRAANKALDLGEAMDRFNGHSLCKLKLRLVLDAAPAVVV